MSSTPERKTPSVTVEECREQARDCLQEANKAHAEPRAAWLKLAARWAGFLPASGYCCSSTSTDCPTRVSARAGCMTRISSTIDNFACIDAVSAVSSGAGNAQG
jgi:hypothetical protein